MTELDMEQIIFDLTDEELFELYERIEADMERRGMLCIVLGDEEW